MKKRYLIIEQGEYSDYGVSIVEVPRKCPLTDEEIVFLLKIDQYDTPTMSGEIIGEVFLFDNASIDIKDIKTEAKSNINRLFSCFDNREYKTVLDKKYTKEECLKIATTNDSSGIRYWTEEINHKYAQYERGFELYNRLSK